MALLTAREALIFLANGVKLETEEGFDVALDGDGFVKMSYTAGRKSVPVDEEYKDSFGKFDDGEINARVVVTEYAVSGSNIAPPSSAVDWDSEKPEVLPGQYRWTRILMVEGSGGT